MTETPRPWKTRHHGIEYGPYSDAEVISFIPQRRINADTEVQHPQHTQGIWLTAKQVKFIRDGMEQATVPPVQRQSSPPALPKSNPYQTLPNPTRNAEPTRRRTRYGVWKWVLLGLWGTWFVGLSVVFLHGVMWIEYTPSLDQSDSGQKARVFLLAMLATQTAVLAAVTGIPLIVISVVAFFFATDR